MVTLSSPIAAARLSTPTGSAVKFFNQRQEKFPVHLINLFDQLQKHPAPPRDFPINCPSALLGIIGGRRLSND